MKDIASATLNYVFYLLIIWFGTCTITINERCSPPNHIVIPSKYSINEIHPYNLINLCYCWITVSDQTSTLICTWINLFSRKGPGLCNWVFANISVHRGFRRGQNVRDCQKYFVFDGPSPFFLTWFCDGCGMPTGDAYSSGHLVPSLWDLHMFYLLRPILFRTCRYFTGLCSPNIPRYFLDFAL